MVSPEMLPTHLRDIKNRLISSPKWVKHDRMILDQAAEALDNYHHDHDSGLAHEWLQKYNEVRRGQNKR